MVYFVILQIFEPDLREGHQEQRRLFRYFAYGSEVQQGRISRLPVQVVYQVPSQGQKWS